MRRCFFASVVACGTALSPLAAAGDVVLAQRHFEEGKRLLAANRVKAACERLAASVKEDPGLGARFKLAECRQRLGLLASAWHGYMDVASSSAERGQLDRERIARGRAAALEGKIERVVFVVRAVDLPGLVVLRDGQAVGRASWGASLPVDPGSFVVRAEAPGRAAFERRVVVAPGAGTTDVVVPELAPLAAASVPEAQGVATVDAKPDTKARAKSDAAPSPSPPPASAAPADAEGDATVWTRGRGVAVAAGGVGLALTLGGAVLGMQAISKNDESANYCRGNDCSPRGTTLRNDALEAARMSTLCVTAGVAAVGGGVALWVLSPAKKAESGAISVTAAPTAGGVAVLATGVL